MTLAFEAFRTPALQMFGTSAQTMPYANTYISLYLLGTVFVMISLGMNSFINAQGFGKTGMLTVLIGAILNILLDPIFIFTSDMGVKGAAIAPCGDETGEGICKGEAEHTHDDGGLSGLYFGRLGGRPAVSASIHPALQQRGPNVGGRGPRHAYLLFRAFYGGVSIFRPIYICSARKIKRGNFLLYPPKDPDRCPSDADFTNGRKPGRERCVSGGANLQFYQRSGLLCHHVFCRLEKDALQTRGLIPWKDPAGKPQEPLFDASLPKRLISLKNREFVPAGTCILTGEII